MRPDRALLGYALDALLLLGTCWYLMPAHRRQLVIARAWRTASAGCYAAGHALGRAGMAAEAQYYEVLS